MTDTTVPVLVAHDAEGGAILRAPKLGLWSGHPQNGTLIEPGSPVGTLTQLRRRFLLVVPEGVSGRVEIVTRPQRTIAVEYGEPLLRVAPSADRTMDLTATSAAAATPEIQGPLRIVAPTDGVFYRAPAIDARPYVIAGDRVVWGQPIGLIEVMKTFNPIAYGDASLPDEAEIVEVLVADGAEIRVGQPLVIVKRL